MKANKPKLLVIPSIIWACFGFYYALNGFTFNDTKNGAVWLALGLGLILLSMLACIFKQTRMEAVLSLVILLVFGISEIELRSHRLNAGIHQLEMIYSKIAVQGLPFPQSIDRSSYENPSYLQWYYQINSEHNFSIVYIVSSDGWAMEYPSGKWRFIGYYPNGYEPNKSASSNSDSVGADSE